MMNPYRTITICSLSMFICALFLSGCARSQPTCFYLLSSLDAANIPAAATNKTNELSLAIGPIAIPEYLDRPQIVTRSGANTIKLAEFDRWAEPLKRNLARVLAENLSFLLDTDRVVLYPSRRAKFAVIQVPLEVIQLDGALNGPARLQVRWTLLDNKGNSIKPERKSDYRDMSNPATYEELAEQYTRLVAQLSEEIAEAVRRQVAKK